MRQPCSFTAIMIGARKYLPAFLVTMFFFHSFGQPSVENSGNKLEPAADSRKFTEGVFPLSDSTPFIVGDIYITGNHKTKQYIVERELSFKKGDTVYLPDLVRAFQKGHDNLINTHLFNDVVVYLKRFRGYIADIEIDVKERWYIFPVPYLVPVDRNLAAWAARNYSFSRVDYGLKYTQFNFSGRNDNLMAWLITGYSQQV